MSCLLALTIFATLPSHSPIQIQAEPKEVILVLAKSEIEIDVSDLTTETANRDSLAKIGLDCHEFVVNDHRIFISEQVAPIKSYQSASKLTAELQRNNSSTFAFGSEVGKILQEVFESVSMRKDSQASPTDNCFALALQLSFNTEQSALKVPVTTPVGVRIAEVARPLRGNPTEDEVKEFSKNRKRTFAQQLGEFTKFNYIVKPLDQKRLYQEDAVEASIAVSAALNEAAKLVHKYFREYAQNHAVLLNRLTGQYANELASIPKDGVSFEKLPLSIQAMIRNSVLDFSESYGFASEAEAERFLDTNPIFKVNFTLSLFEGSSTINPRTGEINRQGIFINLGNPGNPDKPN